MYNYIIINLLKMEKEYCENCNNENVAWSVPNELWLKVCNKKEILCPLCFTKRLYKVISSEKYCIGFDIKIIRR